MRKAKLSRVLSLVPVFVLITAMALFAWGCGDKKTDVPDTAVSGDAVSVGEGDTRFILEVDGGDKKTVYDVKTDEKTVGDALQELGLIEGEEAEYGLYVKTVDGITADFDADGTYWAFYANGEYALTGADMTDIVPGTVYSFVREKG